MAESTMIRIRSAGILFGLLQIFSYPDPYPPGTRELALWIMGSLAVGNLLVWCWSRLGYNKGVLSICSFSLDALALIGMTFVFTFDKATVMWALLYFLPLEGSLRWGLRGSMAAMGIVTVAYTAREFLGANAYGHAFEWTSISFRMGIGFMIAAVSGASASNLMRDRRRLELANAEVTQSRALLAHAQQIARVGSWTWDVATDEIAWSEELHRIFGTDPGPAIDYPTFLAYIHAEDRVRVKDVVTASFRSGDPFCFEHRIVRPDGHTRIIFGQGEVERGAGGTVVRMVGTAQDITDRKLAEEKLHQAYEKEREVVTQLIQIDRQKSDFLSTVAHELRTPLTAIGGFATTLDAKWDQLSDEDRDLFLTRISAGTRQLNRLIEELLDFSRLERSLPELDLKETELRSQIELILRERNDLLSNHELKLDVPHGFLVMSDYKALARVMENLLTNATKFSPAGSQILISARPGRGTRRATSGRFGEVVVRVEDQGIGISEHESQRIFERFYRVSHGDSSPSGTGIGLAIVKDFVEAMGGSVWARPRPGRGTVVGFALPSPGLVTRQTIATSVRQSPGLPAPA